MSEEESDGLTYAEVGVDIDASGEATPLVIHEILGNYGRVRFKQIQTILYLTKHSILGDLYNLSFCAGHVVLYIAQFIPSGSVTASETGGFLHLRRLGKDNVRR